MNWKRKFSDLIRQRGQRYFQRNQVRDLSYKDQVYTANVLGASIYRVEIKVEGEKPIRMKCSCPYAASGQHCKHMAAVLYAIEEEGDARGEGCAEEFDVRIRPFEPTTENYQYFDMGRIAGNLEFSGRDIAKARQLVQEGKVNLAGVEVGYRRFMHGTIKCGAGQGDYQDKENLRHITLLFDRESIIKADCGVSGCTCHYDKAYYYTRTQMCTHVLALLFLVDEYLKKYNPGDSTDRDGTFLFNEFRGQHAREIMGQQEELRRDLILEPVLEKGFDDLQLSFKIGTDKLYVAKNLTEFVNLYENQDMLVLGTKTEIDLGKHRFSDSSKIMYQYVQRIVKDELDRAERLRMTSRYYYETEEIKSRIPLYGDRLDRFYELLEGQSISCNDKSGGKMVKTSCVLQDGKPDIRLQIKKDVDEEQTFHGIRVTGKVPSFIQGSRYHYYFAKEAFCRIKDEVSREIEPLLELGKSGDFSFCVGRKHLSEFYHDILPKLKRNVKVEEPEAEAIQEYIPPEAVFAFYLDVEQGVVYCKAKARYGDHEVSLLDNLKRECVYESFRNSTREEEVLYLANRLFQEIDLEQDELSCKGDEEAVLQLLDGGIERLMALGEVHTTERFRSLNVRRAPKLKIGVSLESDVMNLSVSSEDLDQEELLWLLKNYQRKKKYYRLRSGDLAAVNEADMEMLSQVMETLQMSPGDLVKGNKGVPLYRALYLNKALEQGEDLYLNRDKHFKRLVKEFKTVEDSEFEVPASLTSIMRNYQVRGFRWMKTLEQYGFGGILADDMGLGKTLQMISLLLSAKESGKLDTALIISPASLVYNWKEEFARFAPELKVKMIVGNQQERAGLIRSYRDSDVLVTSYDLLKRDITEYEAINFTYQVLDEAQYIKNHGTAAAKSTKVIKSRHRYALTGTPIENRLSELWSIFDYLMPGFLYSYDTFRKELETPIVKHKDEYASERLKKMVAPFILRRLKGDVLKDLPDKIEEIRYAKLEAEQQQLYDAQVLHMRKVLSGQNAEDFQKNKLQILAELTKIRQICCDPELLFEKYRGGCAKRTACMELIQSAIEGEHKILIFSQFTSMLELLEQDLKEQHIAYYKIIGATPKEKRMEMVNEFNEDSTPVFLISLKAGGTGLNLTGADVVIHYDPWWNQAVQNQATDRAHRIGQTKVVSVYKLIVKDTIEEKIVNMQESKKDLADTILSGETGGIAQMSKEELLELLGD